MIGEADLKGYFDEVKSWNADRLRAAERSRRLAWSVAGLVGVVATVAVGAVALGAGVGATVWGEKAMFRWGQRRRAAGRRWPFGLPALIMGALAIVGNLAEPPKA